MVATHIKPLHRAAARAALKRMGTLNFTDGEGED